ncbi:hypothetical protein EVAR_20846_1 [Eumeta japonica]|uniref:Uncharacterized protein n=1 Tax=Eumeta variegata TaxID=151549 RepID=A0A4C1UEX4_EUMVA|nr:hypothetical protein EVAR_20846_1 [Eumeta japonica]
MNLLESITDCNRFVRFPDEEARRARVAPPLVVRYNFTRGTPITQRNRYGVIDFLRGLWELFMKTFPKIFSALLEKDLCPAVDRMLFVDNDG